MAYYPHHRQSFPFGLLLILFIVVIIALTAFTWNSLPNNTLFPIKTTLESAVGLPISFFKEPSIQFQLFLLNRRVSESEQSLTQGSVKSLTLIKNQAARIDDLIPDRTTPQNLRQSKIFADDLNSAIISLDTTAGKLTEIAGKVPNTTSPTNGRQQPTSNSPFSLPDATQNETNEIGANDLRFTLSEIAKTQNYLQSLLAKHL